MTFEFLIAVHVKNDALTQETDPRELQEILMGCLVKNAADDLPWVLEQDIAVITRDTRS